LGIVKETALHVCFLLRLNVYLISMAEEEELPLGVCLWRVVTGIEP
jgi:hypothetical protein